MCIRDRETTSSVVCVDSQGERRFLYNPGSTSAMTAEDVGSAQLERADIVFIAGAMLLTELVVSTRCV